MIIRKKKYYFNTSTLTFEEIKYSRRTRIIRAVLIAGFFIVTGTAGVLLNLSGTSAEALFLEKKISALKSELNGLLHKSRNYEAILQSSYFPADNIYRTILNIDTIPLSMRFGGTGGSAASGALVSQDNISYQLKRQIDKLNVQVQLQRLSFQNVLDKAEERELMLKNLPAIQPVSVDDVIFISSFFGSRSDPFNHEGQQVHAGLDFVAQSGVNVYATGDGIVTLCQNSRTGYGNEIVVDHAFGYSSRYAHLQEILVKEGEEVKRGQIIGKVGSSGRSTGPHLHYEVRFENKAVDPALFFENLKPEEYNEILTLANKGN